MINLFRTNNEVAIMVWPPGAGPKNSHRFCPMENYFRNFQQIVKKVVFFIFFFVWFEVLISRFKLFCRSILTIENLCTEIKLTTLIMFPEV